MTINSETRVAGPFDGNDSTVSFPFTFKVFDSDEVRVVAETGAVETDLELGTDYTVTLNADQNAAPGGSVVLVDPLATGTRLTLTSALEMLQPVDLTNQGGFYPRVINSALDRLTILLQQLASVVSRTLKFPLSDGPVGDLPGRSVRAGTVLAFDEATGEPVAGPDIASVNGVAGALAAVSTVADNIADVNTVAGNIADVNTVVGNIADVNTVVGNIADVNTVAGNIADVNTVAGNIADLSNFSGVYYGPSATDPTTRRDGSPLQVGDLYFNTVTNAMRAYNGSAWRESVTGAVTVQNLSGDGVETEFLLDYAPESEVITNVFVNGVYQQKNTYALGGANGDVLIFDEAPPVGAGNIEVVVSSLIPSDDKLRQELAGDGGAAMLGRGVVAVDSIADLMALPEGQRREDLRYLVASYHGGWADEVPYRGPRGGGEFYWAPTHPRSFHNGITVIDPAAVWDGSKGALDSFFSHVGSGNGCFMRRVTGVLNLHDCGASGDGSTDDTVPAQAGLDYIGKLGGGCLLVPEADFLVTNLIMKYASISVQAMGPRSCFLRPNDFTTLHRPTIWIARNHCSVIGVRFTYTGWDSTNMASLLTMRPDGSSYYGCHIAVGYTEMWTAINTGVYNTLFGVQLQIVRDTLIDGVSIVGAAVHGVALMNAVGNEVRNCSIREFKGTGVYGWIAPQSEVCGNEFHSSRDDAVYFGGADGHMNGGWTQLTSGELINISIHDNKAFKIGAKGYSASGYNGVSIHDNYLKGSRASAAMAAEEASQGVSASTNVTIRSNQFIDVFGGWGTPADGYGYDTPLAAVSPGIHYAIDLSKCSGFDVTNNIVTRTLAIGANGSYRSGFGSDSLAQGVISGNTFKNFARGNIGSETGGAGAASRIQVFDNTFRDEVEPAETRLMHIGPDSVYISLRNNRWASPAGSAAIWAAIWIDARSVVDLEGDMFDLPYGLAKYNIASGPARVVIEGLADYGGSDKPSSISPTIVYLTGPPTTGTWVYGTIAFNREPWPGEPIGWACVTAGSPGQWSAFGVLA